MKYKIAILCIGFSLCVYALSPLEKAEEVYSKGDYVQAKKRFEKLVKNGNPKAQYDLGYLYEQGQEVKKDDKTALKWYKKAAKQGHLNAQYNTATFYYEGRGTKQDYQKALYWYMQAVKQGDPQALYNLGVMYLKA